MMDSKLCYILHYSAESVAVKNKSFKYFQNRCYISYKTKPSLNYKQVEKKINQTNAKCLQLTGSSDVVEISTYICVQ